MSEHPTTQPKPHTRGWVKILLALSLALNLAILGLVGGAVLGNGANSRDHGDSPALRTLGLGPFTLALPREDRAELRARIAENSGPLRDDRQAIGDALRQVQAALRVDPFDRSAAEVALAQSRDRLLSLQRAGHMALLDQIDAMSAADRADLAASMDRVMRRFGPRRH